MLDAVIPANDFLGPVRGKGESARLKKSDLSQLASVPDHDTVEVGWNENQHVDMQGQSSKADWQPNYASGWSGGQETEDGVTPSKPPISKDASLEAVVNETATEVPSVSIINIHDDEMVCWLQYPLDDTLERNYCSDFFGELPNSNMQVWRESFVGQGTGRAQRIPLPGNSGNDAIINRAASAEAALLLGAGRVAGLVPQTGAEAFSKVRTLHPLQPSVSKWQPHTPNSSKGFNLYPTASLASSRAAPPTSGLLSTPMLPPKLHPAAAYNPQAHQANKAGPMNFYHFSHPAARVKASLHSLAGINSGPTPNVLLKQQPGKPVVEASTSTGSSIAESTTTGRSAMGSGQEGRMQLGVSDREQQNLVGDARWPTPPSSSPAKEMEGVVSEGECKSIPMDQETCRLSSVTSDALASSEKGGAQGMQQPDVQEPTITSSSGGSGTSAERAKDATTSTKRKAQETEDTECHSEDGEDESVDLKKPLTRRGSTTKRSRAAEVHNLSERRRRDRINEKMKALQELIPNSNKTDKASMLDEAIEYLKMLQLQLQMMSIRSGMTLPPMVRPSGLQQQLPDMPPMGMGMMGVQMGLGMGMMDMGVAASGRAVPMPSHAGPSLNGSVQNLPNMVDVHDFRFQNSNVMELNAYLARQHQPMQISQALNLDMYNAYLLQQHQLQQHQYQQHQFQQHQQHHHQTPNMGGGPPH